ncbi:uncharacterized protein LOC133204857 [Saccostrea echinata]|uniref:uncharacterized protein LOC133204857 n=1 Tax=Saccostrea echinata TaxID=191078 RepID=UPI002A83792E|nr:uncharacterized protein LOC133204857 [Saccostrea echinata]
MPETCCCVPECSNRGGHAFPSDQSRRKIWIHAIKRGETRFQSWEPKTHAVVCRAHFKADDYVTETQHGTTPLSKRLKKSAVPSIFSWVEPSPHSQARSDRAKSRGIKRKLAEEFSSQSEDVEIIYASDELQTTEEVVFDSTIVTEASEIPKVETNLYFQNVETQTPKHPPMSIDNFTNDDAGVHFYTGLETLRKFYFVLRTLGPAAYYLNYVYHQVSNISVPDQFFLVLCKLRRHTTNFELSRLFGISEKNVSNIFSIWILFMNKQWREIDLWPSRHLVKYFCPSDFKIKFPNTRVIIDGTECPIKKPKLPKSQQATFSTYKNRNTVKVLVGATPGGLTSYISTAYGGSTSDRQIVERSCQIDMCNSGDSIMADKGLNVQDMFVHKNIQINTPTFFKKKNRMSCETVIKDRKISSKRVHIERIIGLAKTYKILSEPMNSLESKHVV